MNGETYWTRKPATGVFAGIAAACLLTISAVGIDVSLPRPLNSSPAIASLAASDSDLDILPDGAPPEPEPVELIDIAPEDARSINAAVAFIDGPFDAAKPFRLAGDEIRSARAVDCLASAGLYEAGDDPGGQRAVAQVIINRLRHPAFPNTICGVVFQGSERRTGCQFTFTCDGSLARRYSAAAWERARGIATAALTGSVDRRVGLATHYHTDWVVPYWSTSLDKLAAVDTHLFFRWKGPWGRSPAFRSATAAQEPLIAALSPFSASHSAVSLPDAALAEGILPDAPPAASRKIAVYDNTVFVTAAAGSSAGSLQSLALAQCGAREYCKLFGWTDAADMPPNGELTALARASMVFSYLRDKRSGFERALFDCGTFSGIPQNQCMKGR